MFRLWGSSKPKAPAPTLDQAVESVDKRVEHLNRRISQIDAELTTCRDRMKKCPPQSSSYNNLKQRALKLLQQKKMYEGQRDSLYSQSFNLEQANFTQQTMKDTAVTVQALQAGANAMKASMKELNIDEVDGILDDMEDMYEISSEIQDVMSRTYGMPEVDDMELEAELDSLAEGALFGDEQATPDYLVSARPTPTMTSDSSFDLSKFPEMPSGIEEPVAQEHMKY